MRTTFASLLLCLFAACSLSFISCQGAEKSAQVEEASATPKAQTVALTTDGLQIGEKAPDFKLPNIDGKMYSLADVKDANGKQPKGYIVTFTCNTCPFAVKYEDRLIELHNKMSAKGYPLVAIQPNDPQIQAGDSMEAMKTRAKEKQFPFLYLMDEGQTVYPQYGARRTPEIYLLDNERVLRYHGAVDDNAQNPSAVNVNYVEKAIAALESGAQPDPAEVKAIGCSIKAKKP